MMKNFKYLLFLCVIFFINESYAITFGPGTHTINTNQTYSGMTIEAGATVTITAGAIVEIGGFGDLCVIEAGTSTHDGGKLIIEQGSILEHGAGIIIEGKIGKSQDLQGGRYWQGSLILENGTIRHMRDIHWTRGIVSINGGIIQATNSTISGIDEYMITFEKYSNYSPLNPSQRTSSISFFKGCTFNFAESWTGSSGWVIGQITINGHYGVKFLGCTFNHSSGLGSDEVCINIKDDDQGAIDYPSKVIIDDDNLSSPAVPSVFNLSDEASGIYVSSNNSSTQVRNTEFNDCYRCIIAVGKLSNLEITDNDFEVARTDDGSMAISLDGPFFFKVENNQINYPGNTSGFEKGDYILDWRKGEIAYRYSHYSDPKEVEMLIGGLDLTKINEYQSQEKGRDAHSYKAG